MRFSVISGLLALATTSLAQTPEGFTPAVTSHLDVVFGSKSVSPAGTSLTKAESAKMPTIGTSGNLTGTYLFFMIDLDVPGGGTARRTLLHAMIQDFKPSGQTANGVRTLTSSATGPASYMGPAPPAETPAHPHHYVEILYEQPANFAIPAAQKSAVSGRMGFSMPAFATAAGLGEPIAANYFTVTG